MIHGENNNKAINEKSMEKADEFKP